MNGTRFFALILGVFSSSLVWAASDSLAQERLTIRSSDAAGVLQTTVENVKDVFERYEVALDSGTQIVSPLQVGGTQSHPVIKVTLKKCVAFICKTVNLDSEISVDPSSGSCAKNFVLTADLQRSGQILTDVYDRFNVAICMKNVDGQTATLDLTATAHRAPSYESGMIQKQIFQLLQMQIRPIVKALNETLHENGSH